MKKLFFALALCLATQMPHSAYAMEDFTRSELAEKTALLRKRTKKSDEQTSAVIQSSQPFKLSDWNPYTWTPRGKLIGLTAVGIVYGCCIIIWSIYRMTSFIDDNSVKKCPPKHQLNVTYTPSVCNDNQSCPTETGVLELMLNWTVQNGTNLLCHYAGKNPHFETSFDYTYKNCWYNRYCLRNVTCDGIAPTLY
jgi:hypothetical protein